MADMLLVQAGEPRDARPSVFDAIVDRTVADIRRGRLTELNEKFDGSPAILFGCGEDAFIAYKGGLARKTGQILLRTEADVDRHYGDKPDLASIFKHLVRDLLPALRELKGAEFAAKVFQGDVIFTGHSGREIGSDRCVNLKPNTVEYKLDAEHPLLPLFTTARAGVFVHTIGELSRNESNDRLEITPTVDRAGIRACARALSDLGVAACDPYQNEIELPHRDHGWKGAQGRIARRRVRIESALDRLSDEFREEWGRQHLSRFRIFFNSALRPGGDGGIYAMAARGERGRASVLLEGFEKWLESRFQPEGGGKARESHAYQIRWQQFRAAHGEELKGLLDAYLDANVVQVELGRFIAPALRSKIGGRELEGVIFEEQGHVLKWVDRLDFTKRNNERRAPKFDLPAPLDVWRPGSLFVVGKFQPLHAGHVAMIKTARESGAPVFVLASDKEPNLTAAAWKDLGIAGTKTKLVEGEWEHVFGKATREALFSAAGISDGVVFLPARSFWSYVAAAATERATGTVKLVVGEKEVTEGRYQSQLDTWGGNLELFPVPLALDGISGTDVRTALSRLASGEHASTRQSDRAVLDRGLSYIANKGERGRAIDRLVDEYRRVSARVREVLGG